MAQLNTLSSITKTDPIDDSRVQYYIDQEIQSQPYLSYIIANQKKVLQFLAISAGLLSLGTLDSKHTMNGKLTFLGLACLTGVASLRAKRQQLEQKIDIFATASEKFATHEIINSEPKTLSFVSGQKYIYRFKSIQNHNKNIHKVQLVTSVATTGLLSAFFFDKIDAGVTLMSASMVLTASNIAQLINAKQTIKKVKSTFLNGTLPPFLIEQRTKE